MALSLAEKLKKAAAAHLAESASTTTAILDGMDARADSPPPHKADVSIKTEDLAGKAAQKTRSTGTVHRNGPPEPSTEQIHRNRTPKPYTETGDRNRTPTGTVHRNRTPESAYETVHRNHPPESSTGTVHRNSPPNIASTPVDATRLLPRKELVKTEKQRRLFAFLQANPDITTTHAYISDAIGQRKNTVRDNLNLFAAQGLIKKSVVRVPGSGVALRIQLRSTETVHRNGPPEPSTETVHRTFPLKIDRLKTLSISLEAIRIKWPTLARAGFGPEQLAQIEAVRTETGEPCDRVVQGLDHLEYELANDLLRDKAGQPVADPCSWAFRALAQNGYYRRPKGYVSPEEQAARDAEAEAKAVTAARQQADQARFEAWRDALTPDELAQAMQGHPGGNKEAWLKKMWKAKTV